jgi:hypothetical protein
MSEAQAPSLAPRSNWRKQPANDINCLQSRYSFRAMAELLSKSHWKFEELAAYGLSRLSR